MSAWDGNGWRHQMSPCELVPHLEHRIIVPPIEPPAPLPGLTAAYERRLTTETIAADALDVPSLFDELAAKVGAEDRRMRRLLPPAPDGYAWIAELQTHNPVLDFERGRGTVEARIVYRLEAIGASS